MRRFLHDFLPVLLAAALFFSGLALGMHRSDLAYQQGYSDGRVDASRSFAVPAEDSPAAVRSLPVESVPSSASDLVCVTAYGSCYHRPGCAYLAQSRIELTLEEARAGGYTPCTYCNPPQ